MPNTLQTNAADDVLTVNRATDTQTNVDTLSIILLSLALAMDAFAVSAAFAVAQGAVTGRQTFRIAFHFGLFQALMPIVGWLLGELVSEAFLGWNRWVAFVLLAFVGGRAIYGALTGDDESESREGDASRGLSLIVLSTAVSLDAMAVGVGFAAVGATPWVPVLWIGAVASLLSLVGLRLGERLGRRVGRRAELLGGFVLVGIGLRILLSG